MALYFSYDLWRFKSGIIIFNHGFDGKTDVAAAGSVFPYEIRAGIRTVFRYNESFATVYKGNIIKNLIMDCQSYTKYRPNETTGGIFVSWRRKEELPTGA